MRVVWSILLAGCGFQSQPAIFMDTSPAADATVLSPGPGPDATVGGSRDAGPGAPTGPFDYARCPVTYTNDDLPGPSRYRVITDGHRAWEQSDACNGDLPGATHLVIFETAAELTRAAAFVDHPRTGLAHNAVWVGGVQRRTAEQPRDGWLGFDGAALIDLWQLGDPDDNGNSGEADHREQFAMIDHHNVALADDDGRLELGAICECDGAAVPAAVLAAIDANRVAD